MSRTPLFAALRRNIALARLASLPGAPPAGELVEQAAGLRATRWSRRQFLRAGALAGVALGAGCAGRRAGVEPPPSRGGPRVAIVGAGIAGLHAAHVLRKAGIRAEVFEASNRAGGRMLTAAGLLGPGLTTELGGEFIDSNHEDMRNLAGELGLELVDVEGPSEAALAGETYLFGGQLRTDAELVEAFRPLATRIEADVATLGETIDFENDGNARDLDATSLAEYLTRIGAAGWVGDLLEVAFVTEYGLDAGDQSSLNLLQMIATDVSGGKVKLLGESDERYKVRGGNQQVVDGLAARLEGQVRREHRLVALAARGQGYRLDFAGPGGAPVLVDADAVVLALPFTTLREVELKVELPAWKRRAIAELGYGTNAKVMAGFDRRVWRERGYGGNVYGDEPFQLAWDSSRLQPGAAGSLTLYSGGRAGLTAGEGTAGDQTRRLLPGLERAFPGLLAAHNGKVGRFHWPSHPYTRGSYAAYRPGQWTSIGGAEGRPVGRLFFAGEHTSSDFQGFMNGGAESGRVTAEAVLAALGVKAAGRTAGATRPAAGRHGLAAAASL